MTIIDKSKKAPVFVYKPPPIFKTTLDEQRYWEKEKVKWVEGNGSVPGSFYWACQMQKVKDRVSGITSRYDPREGGLLVHEFVADQIKKKRMGGVIKPRGCGFSTEIGGLGTYFTRVFPGSTAIFTSKDQSGIQTIFKEKILPAYEGLPESIRPGIINRNDTKQQCYLRLSVPTKDQDGNDIFAESEIFLRETSETPKSPTNLSGKGARFGAYDEFPLHPRRTELLKSSIECYRNPVTKALDGFLLWGGTVEENLNAEDLVKFRTMVNDSSIWQCDVLFIPFWMQMYLTNGRPDRVAAERWWDEEYRRLSEAQDTTLLRAFMRNNPRSLDDIFEAADGSRWEDDVADKIKYRRKYVINNPPPRKVGKLMDMGNNGTFTQDVNGPVIVIEDPKSGIQYYQVIDGVATGSETSSSGQKGSKVASIIIKGFDPDGGSYAPVCLYFERPKTVEQSYINICAQARMYNRFGGLKGIMAEANAATADHFSTHLKKAGLAEFIMYKQKINGANAGPAKKTTPFYYVTNDVRDYQVKQANIFLRKYIDSIDLLELLEQMLMGAEENTDILDAWLMLMLALPPDFDATPKEKRIRRRQVRVYRRDSSGRLVSEWITV